MYVCMYVWQSAHSPQLRDEDIPLGNDLLGQLISTCTINQSINQLFTVCMHYMYALYVCMYVFVPWWSSNSAASCSVRPCEYEKKSSNLVDSVMLDRS